MNFDPRLADNMIQEILDNRGWTQKYLAELLGWYQSDISDIIHGKVKNLTLVRAARISVTLGYSVETIWPSLFKR